MRSFHNIFKAYICYYFRKVMRYKTDKIAKKMASIAMRVALCSKNLRNPILIIICFDIL